MKDKEAREEIEKLKRKVEYIMKKTKLKIPKVRVTCNECNKFTQYVEREVIFACKNCGNELMVCGIG